MSTWIASWPVRWMSNPAGRRGRERRANRIDDALRLGSAGERDDGHLDERVARLAVRRDAEIDDGPYLVDGADLFTTRSKAALSSWVRPPSRAATRVATANEASWNGAAITAACMLGELAGRKPLVVSFATSASEGRNRTARNVMTIQASTTRNRQRTVNCPRLVKKRLIESLSWTNCDGVASGRRR